MKFSCLPLRTVTWLLVSCASLTVHAESVQSPEPHSREALLAERAQVREQSRQEIEAQRQVIEARKLEGETLCWQRFAVESCLRDVRAQAREQGNVLRTRELAINSEERQEKASERLRTIEQKKSAKQASTPVQTSVRKGEAPASTPSGEPAPAAARKTPEDVAAAESERAQTAQQRAAETRERLNKQQAQMAERTLTEDQRREKAKKNMQDKRQAAEAHRTSKAGEIAQRKGAPLPIPEGVPAP